MKKGLICLLILFLLCRFLYPHTRFGFTRDLDTPFKKRLNIESATLLPGETISLRLTGIKKTASYSSSDFRIASVSPLGTVHAHNPGTAVISVSQQGKTYHCKITVSNPSDSSS